MLCKKPVLCEPREMTRKERRANKWMGEGEKRAHMRRMYEALGVFALDSNDNAVMTHLLKYRPFTRLKNPESKGIDKAYQEMREYLAGVQEDVRIFEREKNMDEFCDYANAGAIS